MRRLILIIFTVMISGMTIILPACSNQAVLDKPQTSNDTPSSSTSFESPSISPDTTSEGEEVSQPVSDPVDSTSQEQNLPTELFLEFEGAHGIVFDDNGSMFIAKKTQEIFKVTPDAQISLFMSVDSLADKTDRTKIWSMHMGPGGYIYAAAGDRILKINDEGEAETFLTDDFAGEWGACDLAFDPEGNLYVVHDKMVEKYRISPDTKPERTTLLDGRTGSTLLRAVVGICFGDNFKSFYVSDVFGNKVTKCTLNAAGTIENIVEYESLRSAEYLAADNDGNIYVSLPAGKKLVRIGPSGENLVITADDIFKDPTTLAFGKDGFETGSLYVTARGGVYRVTIKE